MHRGDEQPVGRTEMLSVRLQGRAPSAAALLAAWSGWSWRWTGSGDGWGTLPRGSGDEARQATESEMADRLIRGAGRQVDLDLRRHLDDAGGDLHQAKP
jgi:hypothetical protein